MSLTSEYPKEYSSYSASKDRCTNPNCDDFPNYGGRGIKFLYNNFKEFIEDVGPKPALYLTIDRINTDGNYEPGNCRWITREEQNKNKRNSKLVPLKFDTVTGRAKELRKKIVMAELPLDLYIRMNTVREMINLSINQFLRGMLGEYIPSLEEELGIDTTIKIQEHSIPMYQNNNGERMNIQNPRKLVAEKKGSI